MNHPFSAQNIERRLQGLLGMGGEDLLLKEYTVSVGIDEKFLEMSSNDGCTTANIILCWCIEYVNMVNTAHFICMLQLKK